MPDVAKAVHKGFVITYVDVVTDGMLRNQYGVSNSSAIPTLSTANGDQTYSIFPDNKEMNYDNIN